MARLLDRISIAMKKDLTTIFPHMYGNLPFYYTREQLMRYLYEFFNVLQLQKRIVAAATM